jgi:hypothetical protein
MGPGKFTDMNGRHFKQPKEGLGNDDSPTAHMWRTIANPDAPLRRYRRPWCAGTVPGVNDTPRRTSP